MDKESYEKRARQIRNQFVDKNTFRLFFHPHKDLADKCFERCKKKHPERYGK